MRYHAIAILAALVLAHSASAEPQSDAALKDPATLVPVSAVADIKADTQKLSTTIGKAPEPADPFLEKYRKQAACFLSKKFVHTAVQQGMCSACHASVDDPSALNAQGSDLCLSCHQTDADPLKKAHLGITVFEGSCLVCHDPHASSEPKHMREEGQHMPFAANEPRMCDQCHNPTGADGKPALKDFLTESCYGCHDKVIQAAQDSKVVHGALGECNKCHNPHVSARKAHLRDAPEVFCRGCHAKIPDRGHPVLKHRSFKYGPKAKGPLPSTFNCLNCHRPHGGDFEKMLRVDKKEVAPKGDPKNKLCLKCHKM